MIDAKNGEGGRVDWVYVACRRQYLRINAGFFLYQIPKGHERPGTRVIAVAVRDKHGRVLARQPLQYAPPHLPVRTVTSPPSAPHPAATPPTPTPPFQQGSAYGATVVVGSNRVAKFDTSHIAAAVRPLIPNASYGCFRFMQYHQDAPAEFGFAPRTIIGSTIQISGLPTPYDGCEIQGSYGHLWPDSNGSHSAVEIAFTARGRHFFADRAAARDLALFVRSRRMQQIRTEQGQQLLNDIHATYGHALARSRIHLHPHQQRDHLHRNEHDRQTIHGHNLARSNRSTEPQALRIRVLTARP